MRSTRLGMISAVLLVGAFPALVCAQAGDSPPVIVSMSMEYSHGGGAFQPYSPYAPVQEGDVIRLTVEITDLDLPDDEIFVRKQSRWIPWKDYYAPQPGPVSGDSGYFRAPPSLVVSGTSATVVFTFIIPDWQGANQARLRGEINWDVRWEIWIEVSNSEEPGEDEPVARSYIVLLAIENPAFRPPNPPPSADAGADQLVVAGRTVTLDGRRTLDAWNTGIDPLDPEVFEKDQLQFTWEWMSGPVRVDPVDDQDGDPATVQVTLDRVGIYVYRLLVEDGVSAQVSTDTVQIDVRSELPPNSAPTAQILVFGLPASVGETVVLDGSTSSDPEGDELDYYWRQTNALGGELSFEEVLAAFQPLKNASKPVASWKTTTAGTYYFRLLVTDPSGLSDTELVSVQVTDAAVGSEVVFREEGAGSTEGEAQPSGSDDAAPLMPFDCGAGVPLLGLLPVLLWFMRGRMR